MKDVSDETGLLSSLSPTPSHPFSFYPHLVTHRDPAVAPSSWSQSVCFLAGISTTNSRQLGSQWTFFGRETGPRPWEAFSPKISVSIIWFLWLCSHKWVFLYFCWIA